MTRLRIFFGLFSLIMGLPLFVYMMISPNLEGVGGAYAPVCGLIALGVALLYPARWVE